MARGYDKYQPSRTEKRGGAKAVSNLQARQIVFDSHGEYPNRQDGATRFIRPGSRKK